MKISKKIYEEWLAYVDSLQARETPVFEKPEDQKKRIRRLLNDYEAFVQYYFASITQGIPSAPFHLHAAKTIKKNKRLRAVFEWARGHAKSTHISLFIPLWLHAMGGQFETFVLVSKTHDDAKRLLGKIQAHLQNNNLYINDFGKQVALGDWTAGEFETANGTLFIAVGRGQSPRGLSSKQNRRPDFIIVDDIDDDELCRNPRRVKEALEWIDGALFGTMDMGRGRFVMAGNRIHKNSLLANIAARPGIVHTVVNALTPDGKPSWSAKYSLSEIEEVKKFVGTPIFEREYMNNPIEQGAVFKAEWLRFDQTPPLHSYESVVAYIDPSYKTHGDYKAVAIIGRHKGRFYLLDVYCRQSSLTELVLWLYDRAEALALAPVTYYMEANLLQDLLFEEFLREGERRRKFLPLLPDKRSKPNKVARIEATAPLFERGLVIYDKRLKQSPDMQEALDQLLAFQAGSRFHDDFPDAQEGAIWILQNTVGAEQLVQKIRIGKRNTTSYF